MSAKCTNIWLLRKHVADMSATFLAKLISRNKGLHCNFACLLYSSKLINRLPKERVIKIISSKVKIMKELMVDALPIEFIGMNSTMMCNYIKFCAD